MYIYIYLYNYREINYLRRVSKKNQFINNKNSKSN